MGECETRVRGLRQGTRCVLVGIVVLMVVRIVLQSCHAGEWPLLAAAGAGILGLVMLFTPWVSGAYMSVNAFGNGMQAAAPALIIVAVLALLILVGAALRSDNIRRPLLMLALIPAIVLLVLYIVKVGDVQDLIDLNAGTGGRSVSTGVGLWLGLIFAITTVAFVVAASILENRRLDIIAAESCKP